MTEIRELILDKFFSPNGGIPDQKDFKVTTSKFDENKPLEKDQILINLEYISVDPYLRARMQGVHTFVDPFKLHEPINSGCVAKVLKSNCPRFKAGDHVSGYFNWQEKQIVNVTKEVVKVDPNLAPLPHFVGVLGMTGLTAYFGLVLIGKPKKGETIVVSAAGGAVGSIVGQIGKILGCRVVGICGSDEKAKFLKSEFGFDEVVNYKSSTYEKDLKNACPKGIDIYFENVGGKIADPILFLINKHARIPVCGTISTYNAPIEKDIGQRAQYFIFSKQALMQGFLVFDYSEQETNEALKHLSQWIKEGKLKEKNVIFKGYDHIIEAFTKLFNTTNNTNIGKVVIDVTDQSGSSKAQQ
ncbi:hypothetical protein DICPUDRAFT_91936 [Dictyostelium purpureum]|uniref:Enoyl reductase (ER) domain-containing protein n=1 Tax=Dictyostelium purpureum TaxID=5786 RepID=F0ZJH5_DICPU|nr:uncharacterized protein DICPUDRAFT_91936 [Dictyostelium purpureum]EGC35901.1 hypothetical protein DICPUDRAFT_91936 [Dictyostelium purpureum]|eukprot:XP_003287555.1 hypothetical protein DICPUDRAFT_91936 [Dictyostelium purpureum]